MRERGLFPAKQISIHALREEGDSSWPSARLTSMRFLSTPSARRATQKATKPHLCPRISIHALREEGDLRRSSSQQSVADFYPRPPRGGRRLVLHGADVVQPISIHALREEGDSSVSRGAT